MEAKTNKNINFLTAQKMIYRLLTCKRIYKGKELKYTGEELARKLGIESKELEKLKIPHFYKRKMHEITLSLSKLYCATKWADDE